MVLAAVGTVFAAAYLLWLYQRTAFGTVPTEWTGGGHAAHAVGADVNDEHHGVRHPRRDASSSGSPGRRCWS